jgi:hypothetical protein
MERRTRAALVGLLALATACGGGDPARLHTGAAVPAEWRAGARDGRPSVIWVFRTEDCLTCQALDYSLRRLQRSHAVDVSLVAVHVGRREHAGIPRAFFASRRLVPAAAVDVSPRAFRRRYGDATLPVLLLARGDSILWSSANPGQRRLSLEGIDSVFSTYLAGRQAIRTRR